MTLLTTTQVAQRIERDPSQVRRWCERGLLKATKFGRAWMIDEDALETFTPPKRGRPFKAIVAEGTE